MHSKKTQLFILPYAGGSIASFKRLTDLLDENIEAITVEYSGRGTRSKEPLANDIWSMIDDAIDYCMKRRNPSLPYAFMGYSMGSILAYEIIQREVISGTLKHFFVSAEVSPKNRYLELRKISNPTEDSILNRAKKLGGLDERMLANKRFADIYIKPMLSDYRNFFDYQFQEKGKLLKTDATFFYCEKDTALQDVQKWEELIDGRFEYFEFGNNHFFINQHYAEMAQIINNRLVADRG